MNIICNNCVGARLYEVTKQQFPNSFMWMLIMHKDYINFINEYDNLDLQNPKFELEIFNNDKRKSVLITLNNIKLHYIHYIQDESKEIPVKEKSTNILYKDILSYAKNKWFSRLNRSKEEPIFLFSFNYFSKNDKNQYYSILEELLKIKNKKLLILVHEGIKIEKEISDNIKIIYCSDDIMKLDGDALANSLKNMIFN